MLSPARAVQPGKEKESERAVRPDSVWSVRPIEIFAKTLYFQGVSPIGTQCEPMGLNAVYGGKSDFVEQIPQNHS